MTKEQNLIKDLSTLTTIPVNSLNALERKRTALICNYLDEASRNMENIVSVNIGVGTVTFKLLGNEVAYSFVPSGDLEREIIRTLNDGENPLTKMIEDGLSEQLLNVYKDFM